MALSSAQLGDSIYLTNMINNLTRQKEESLRQNEITKNMNLRLLRHTNAMNGLNGGVEESSYARLLAGANRGAADIFAQFDPMIAEYRAYLAALAAGAGSGGGGGGGGKKKTTTSTVSYVNPNNGKIFASAAGSSAPSGSSLMKNTLMTR